LIYVDSDLFGAPLGGDVLGVRQLRPPSVAGERDQILVNDGYRAPRALLPRRIGRRVDHNLTHDSPTSVMRVATRNEKPRQRVGQSRGSGLGCMDVEMPERGTDLAAVIYRPGQFPRAAPRSVSLIVDPSTVPGQAAEAYACDMRLPSFRKGRVAREDAVLIGDPRVEGWESVSTFEDQATAVSWREHLRSMRIDATCVADRPLDRFGRGDIYLMVPPQQWSRANEIVDNLE
jgi:hypothetical protein